MKTTWAFTILFICCTLTAWTARAGETVSSPQQLRVFDTPNDSGGSLTVTWAKADKEGTYLRYQVLLKDPAAAGDKVIAEFASDSHYV